MRQMWVGLEGLHLVCVPGFVCIIYEESTGSEKARYAGNIICGDIVDIDTEVILQDEQAARYAQDLAR